MGVVISSGEIAPTSILELPSCWLWRGEDLRFEIWDSRFGISLFAEDFNSALLMVGLGFVRGGVVDWMGDVGWAANELSVTLGLMSELETMVVRGD